jgi:glutamine synthetase
MLMAVLDGIENRTNPGKPLDKDIYAMTRTELEKTPKVPGSLAEALDSLEKDHKFLTKGGVFTDDLISTYINYKRENEVNEIALRPHPFEFALYYNA